MMNLLLGLPQDLFLVVLEDWIGSWNNIALLDIAVCSKEWRPVLHSQFRNRGMEIKWIPSEETPLRYHQDRKLFPGAVVLRTDTTAQADLLDCTKIRALRMDMQSSCCNRNLDEVLAACSKLRTLEIANQGFSPLFMGNWHRISKFTLPELTHLKLYNLQSLQDHDLVHLVTAAPNITSLHLSHCSAITTNGIWQAIHRLPNLKVLETSNIEPVVAKLGFLDSLSQLDIGRPDHDPTLETLILQDLVLPIQFWKHLIVKHRATLKHVSFPALMLSSDDVKFIFSTASNLEYVDLRCCKFLSPRELLETLCLCPKLHTVYVNGVGVDPFNDACFNDMEMWKKLTDTLPHMRKLHLGNIIKLCDHSLLHLLTAYGRQLEYLAIVKSGWLSDKGLLPLTKYCNNDVTFRHKKRKLVVSEAPNVSVALLTQIQKHSDFEVVSDAL